MRAEEVATVTICQACGDPGFLEALLVCSECKIFVEHRYCQINQQKAFDETTKWLCENCKSKLSQRHISNLAIKQSLQVARLKASKVHRDFGISAVAIEQRFLSIQSWISDVQDPNMAVDATNNLDICDMEAGTLAVEEILGDSDPRFDISGHSSAGLLLTSKPAGDGSMDCKMSLGRKRKLNAEELEDGELIEEASEDEVVKSTESNGQCGNGRNFNKINKYLPLDRGADHGSWKKAARRTTDVSPEYHNDLEIDYSMSQHKMSPRMIEPTDDLKTALLETQSGQPTRTSTAFSCRYSVLKEMKLTEFVNLPREEKVPNARMRLSTVCKYIGKEKNHEIDLRINEQKTPNSNVALEYKLESDSSPAKYKDRNGAELLDHRSSYANTVSSDKITVLPNDLANVQAPEKDDSQRLLTEPSREVCVAPLLHDIWRGCFALASGTARIRCDPVKAHLSDIACTNENVRKGSRMIPRTLYLDMCSRLTSWPNSFKSSKPTANSIALYFIPGGGRAGSVYDELLMNAVKRDCIFKATLEAAELLIIPSIHLPTELHRFQGKFYLWGTFKSKQSSVPANYRGKDEVVEERYPLPCSSPTPQEDATAGVANLEATIGSKSGQSKLEELPRKLDTREVTAPAQNRGGRGHHNDNSSGSSDWQSPHFRMYELPSPQDNHHLLAANNIYDEEEEHVASVSDSREASPACNKEVVDHNAERMESLYSVLRELRALLLAIPCHQEKHVAAVNMDLQLLNSQLRALTDDDNVLSSLQKHVAAAKDNREVVPPADSKGIDHVHGDAGGVDLQSIHSRLHELRTLTDRDRHILRAIPCEEKRGDGSNKDDHRAVAPGKGANHDNVTPDRHPARSGQDESCLPADDPQLPAITTEEKKDDGAPVIDDLESIAGEILDVMDKTMNEIDSLRGRQSKQWMDEALHAPKPDVVRQDDDEVPGGDEDDCVQLPDFRLLCEKADSDGFWRLLITSNKKSTWRLGTHLPKLLLDSCAEPAQFILDVLSNGFPPYSADRGVNKEWACLLLLNSLLAAIDERQVQRPRRPVIVSSKAKKQARELVRAWKHFATKTWHWEVGDPRQPPPHAHVFLALVAAFGVAREHETGLYSSLAIGMAFKRGVSLLAVRLGLDGSRMVRTLLSRRCYMPALFFMLAYGLADSGEFSPARILCNFCRALKGCAPGLMANKLDLLMTVCKSFGLWEEAFPAENFWLQIRELKRQGTRKEAERLREKVLARLERLERRPVRMAGGVDIPTSSRGNSTACVAESKTKKKKKVHREDNSVKRNDELVRKTTDAGDVQAGRHRFGDIRAALSRDVLPPADGNATRKSISFKPKGPAGCVKKSVERNPLRRLSKEGCSKESGDDHPKDSRKWGLGLSWNPLKADDRNSCLRGSWNAWEGDKEQDSRMSNSTGLEPSWKHWEDDKEQDSRTASPLRRRSDDSDCRRTGYKRSRSPTGRLRNRGGREDRDWTSGLSPGKRRRQRISPHQRYRPGSPAPPPYLRRSASRGSPVSSRSPSPATFPSLHRSSPSPSPLPRRGSHFPPSPTYQPRSSPGFHRSKSPSYASRPLYRASPQRLSMTHRPRRFSQSPSPRFYRPSPLLSSSPIPRRSPGFHSSSPTPRDLQPPPPRYRHHLSSPGHQRSTSSTSPHPVAPTSPRSRRFSPPRSPSSQRRCSSPSPRQQRWSLGRSASPGSSLRVAPASPSYYCRYSPIRSSSPIPRGSPPCRSSSPTPHGSPPCRSSSPTFRSSTQSPQCCLPSPCFNTPPPPCFDPSPPLGPSSHSPPHLHSPALSPSSHFGTSLKTPCYGDFLPPPPYSLSPPTHCLPLAPHYLPPSARPLPPPPPGCDMSPPPPGFGPLPLF